MKTIWIGLFALGLFAGSPPKAATQTVTTMVGPETDDSYWVWNDEFHCWIWNGPEFQGDYQGHPYSFWHARHEDHEDGSHRPGKSRNGDGERPVNKGTVEQPRVEIDRSQSGQPKEELEKPKEQQPAKTEVEKPKADEKLKPEAPKEEKSKAEKPKPE